MREFLFVLIPKYAPFLLQGALVTIQLSVAVQVFILRAVDEDRFRIAEVRVAHRFVEAEIDRVRSARREGPSCELR